MRFPRYFNQTALSLLLFAVFLAACQPAVVIPPNPAAETSLPNIVLVPTLTATFTPLPAPTSQPTETPPPTAVATRTPPPLPEQFNTDLLRPSDIPVTYIENACQYLRAKWHPGNAEPGTVIMPIMFHGITKRETNPTATGVYHDMSAPEFHYLMEQLHEQGFEAITMQQAADFLYENARIPKLSVLLIVDDRKNRQSFDDTFYEYYEKWGWPVVNSYITIDESPRLWRENAELAAEGWVDHQAHGYIHNINISEGSREDFIRQELGKPFEMMEKHFSKTPIAYIWPGGGFTPRAVEIMRDYDYLLGFTINPRGPVMYNWVPQAEGFDPNRPSYLPEIPSGDPLLTLPRYWSPAAFKYLPIVREISEQASQYAQSVRETELDYYNIVCAPQYGEIPAP
jgi:hypothetical protein